MTTAGVLNESSPAATQPASLQGISAGPGNTMFATGVSSDRIARSTLAGSVTESLVTPTASSRPNSITWGSDGNMWFTERDTAKIGRLNPHTLAINEYGPVPTNTTTLGQITAGPDGNLWFTEFGASKIGRITPGGGITEFPLPADRDPSDIVAGADGNLWFTEQNANLIGRITPSGTVAEFPSGTANATSIATGPDGNLWFTQIDRKAIARITTALDPPAFQNSAPITITDGPPPEPATPYPSPIAVSGLKGTVTKMTVRLTGIHHTFTEDVSAMLVGPGGQSAILIDDVGGRVSQSATVTFADDAPYELPDNGPLVSGIFKPGNYGVGDIYPAGPPTGTPASTLAAFNGTDPNGTWQLYVADDEGGDGGRIHGGWGIDISTTGGPAAPAVPVKKCKKKKKKAKKRAAAAKKKKKKKKCKGKKRKRR
jgi:sugar lactone lactonase YvrE/subtilisin-like proprotein convertase family protein